MRRLGLNAKETVLNPWDDHPELLALNPLGQVPALKTPEGEALFDSQAILEYLHDLTARIWPSEVSERIRIRQASVAAAGLIQASVAYFQETSMHEPPTALWVKDHFENADRLLRSLLQSPNSLWINDGSLTQAGWDLAVAHEYLALRLPEVTFHRDDTLIRAILKIAEESPDFVETRPKA
jgi:glutathione S-transferase